MQCCGEAARAAASPPARPGAPALAGLFSALLLLALSGCAGSPPGPPARFAAQTGDTELIGTPFHPDTDNYCGPAALATVLGWSGVDITPEALVGDLFLPARGGSLQPEIVARARRADRLAYPIEGGLPTLSREVAAGHPVLVLQNLALNWWPFWHYAVVIGIDHERDELVLRSGPRARHRVGNDVFDRTWARGGRWALVATPPGSLPATAEARPAFIRIGELAATAGDRAALPYWRAAARRWPDDARQALGLANSLASIGRPAAAAGALEPVAEHSGPLQGVVLNNLALLRADTGDLDGAIELARRAVELGGDRLETFRETLRELQRRRVDGAENHDNGTEEGS